MKLAYIDVETTGLDSSRHTVWCIGGILEVGGLEVSRFQLKCAPHPNKILDPEALAVGGVSVEEVMAMPEPISVKHRLEEHLCRHVDRYNKQDKWFFLAYNAPFDYQFLRRWWEDAGDPFFGSMFWFPAIDVMGLAGHHLMGIRGNLKNFKLSSVCAYLGIELTQAHDALHDIEATRELWKYLERERRRPT